ncbi:hypothetical protein HPP92_021228 [Vanilla planifolia]|uniref:Uncharacterized protein n=1 Tax=Vanilla planifolia TaxID=51239 RepID=A0A835Q4E8_VANPL|nr:hypothetical protein HPP92_021228 [Vanilla planifolia]
MSTHLGLRRAQVCDGMIYGQRTHSEFSMLCFRMRWWADHLLQLPAGCCPAYAEASELLSCILHTNGGSEIYKDVRRNSLDEAIKLCLAGGLNGIVSEVKAIFKNPSMIHQIKEINLAPPNLRATQGVIVDLVQEITEVVCEFISLDQEEGGKMRREEEPDGEEVKTKAAERPRGGFSAQALKTALILQQIKAISLQWSLERNVVPIAIVEDHDMDSMDILPDEVEGMFSMDQSHASSPQLTIAWLSNLWFLGPELAFVCTTMNFGSRQHMMNLSSHSIMKLAFCKAAGRG